MMLTTRSGHRADLSPMSGRTFVFLALLLVTILGAIPSARAQNGSQFRNWKSSLNDGAVNKPKLDCRALMSLTGYEFSIETVTPVAAASEIPEYCHVTGQILPEVRFELSLPTSWNSRFYMFGNGGYAGEALSSPSRVNIRNTALKHGFAVAQTNTGHDAAIEPLGSFAVNRQKLLDYAFRAVHITVDTSKRIIRTYYGQALSRSYFDGCSTGGRQGLMSAQRFPDDFDGMVVGAPVLDFSGTMIGYVWNARALDATSLPPEKLKTVAQRVYAKCDGVDGLVDGLIADPRRCEFDPGKDLPICANDANGTECLTAAQVRTLEAIYRGAESGGQRIFWGNRSARRSKCRLRAVCGADGIAGSFARRSHHFCQLCGNVLPVSGFSEARSELRLKVVQLRVRPRTAPDHRQQDRHVFRLGRSGLESAHGC